MRSKAIVLAVLALTSFACRTPSEPAGARGDLVPRHIKPPKDGDDIPDGPMTTLHRLETTDSCGGKCKFRRTGESSLVLHLAKNGVATASDDGEIVERVDASLAKNATRSRWKRVWSGSWSQGDRGIEVRLTPAEQTCWQDDEAAGNGHPCADDGELRLRCHLVQLSLVRPREQLTRAWACDTRSAAHAQILTPLPWVFGVEQSVVVLDGGQTTAPTRRYAFK